jgi:hypothetical protein
LAKNHYDEIELLLKTNTAFEDKKGEPYLIEWQENQDEVEVQEILRIRSRKKHAPETSLLVDMKGTNAKFTFSLDGKIHERNKHI